MVCDPCKLERGGGGAWVYWPGVRSLQQARGQRCKENTRQALPIARSTAPARDDGRQVFAGALDTMLVFRAAVYLNGTKNGLER